MLIFQCPYCGIDADETELSPGGEAHLKRFGPGASDEDFESYLFMRENPKGVHFERWRHAYGCGKLLSPLKRSRIKFHKSDLVGLGGTFHEHTVVFGWSLY